MSRPADDDSEEESRNTQSIPRNKRLKTGHLQMCADRKLIVVLERCQLETVKVWPSSLWASITLLLPWFLLSCLQTGKGFALGSMEKHESVFRKAKRTEDGFPRPDITHQVGSVFSWLFGRLIDWLLVCLLTCPINWLIDWLRASMSAHSIDWLIDWLIDCIFLKLLQCLLMLQDSVLNRSGMLQVFLHTEKNVLIEINPQTRIPRTFDRFAGLMGTCRVNFSHSHLFTETRNQYHFLFFCEIRSFSSSKGKNPRRSEQSETAASDQKSRQWSPASGMPKNQHFRHGEESRHCQPSSDERAYRLRYRGPCSRPGIIYFFL